MKRTMLLIIFSGLTAHAAVHQIAELTPVNSDGVRVVFPSAIAISADGNIIVVGDESARVHSNGGEGAVYVFVKPPAGWKNMTQTATLTASDGYFQSRLGTSVAINGNTIVAGAPGSTRGRPGTAYVFVQPASGWQNMVQTAELTPSDGNNKDYFGDAVSISGNTIVGASPGINSNQGAAYVFVEPSGGWTNMNETAKLVASDGKPGDYMAYAGINGNLILASANHSDDSSTPGEGYIFQGSGNSWTQIAKLTASDWQSGDLFGTGGAFNGDTVVLNKRSSTHVDTAYVFVESPSGWTNMTETAELSASLPPDSYFIAGAISSSGSAILATAPGYDSGTAFLFLKPATGWQTTTSANIEFGSGDGFQYGMQLSANIAALGARLNGTGTVLLLRP